MKPLIVHSGNIFGGIERVLIDLLRGLRESELDFPEFALAYQSRLAEELSNAGAVVHDLGEVRFSRPWTLRSARKRLGELVGRGSYDVGITLSPWGHAAFAVVLKKRVPLVHWQHGIYDGEHRFERMASRSPPLGVVANSEFTSRSTTSVFPGVSTRVVYNPVIARDGRQRTDPRPTIVQVARLDRAKGQDTTLLAARLVRETVGDLRTIIAANPENQLQQKVLDELKKLARAKDIEDSVEFSRDPVGHILAEADVFCHPNVEHEESFGVVFVEAMHAGLPIVATDSGASPEVVGDCGILVKNPTPETVASALLKILDSDRGKYRKLGPERARRISSPANCARDLYSALSHFLH